MLGVFPSWEQVFMDLPGSLLKRGDARLIFALHFSLKGIRTRHKQITHVLAYFGCTGNADFWIAAKACITPPTSNRTNIPEHPFTVAFHAGRMKSQPSNTPMRNRFVIRFQVASFGIGQQCHGENPATSGMPSSMPLVVGYC